MQRRFALLAAAAALGFAGAPPMAVSPPGDFPAAGRPESRSYVSLFRPPQGDPALWVRYPWKVHRRASVEVRLVTGRPERPAPIRPLFFRKEHFRGEVKLAVYRAQDEASGVGVRRPLTDQGLEFQIVGWRNRLEQPAVCVVHRFAGDEEPRGTAAAYCLLDGWAATGRLLYIELPRQDFARPGSLYVWFLRDETVLWEETIDWPGYPARRSPKTE